MDATFWTGISFFIFIGILVYLKIPQKIGNTLDESIAAIKSEVDDAEKLKEESKNILSEYEKKISNSKAEIKVLLDLATDEAEKNVLKINEDLHIQTENQKQNIEDRIKQMKRQALKDIKNASVKIAIDSVESLLKNSLDKNKLNKIFIDSVEETKFALKRKST